MEKRCQMQHVGQTNENVSLSISLFSCKFKIINESPQNTLAICKEIKNNTGYTCTVYDCDEIYLFIIRRQATIVKRQFLVDDNKHLIKFF